METPACCEPGTGGAQGSGILASMLWCDGVDDARSDFILTHLQRGGQSEADKTNTYSVVGLSPTGETRLRTTPVLV